MHHFFYILVVFPIGSLLIMAQKVVKNEPQKYDFSKENIGINIQSTIIELHELETLFTLSISTFLDKQKSFANIDLMSGADRLIWSPAPSRDRLRPFFYSYLKKISLFYSYQKTFLFIPSQIIQCIYLWPYYLNYRIILQSDRFRPLFQSYLGKSQHCVSSYFLLPYKTEAFQFESLLSTS